MTKQLTFPPSDAFILGKLVKDPRLTFHERAAIQAALNRLAELENEKSWSNPYREAIALLESASRSREGGFG